jgi:hypothetical protein
MHHFKTPVAILAAAGLTAGIASVASAAPADSQRLRGMGDRSFAVAVSLEDGTPITTNCYTFEADGTWIDPLAPTGSWEQHRVGARTSYTASAPTPLGDIVQHGTVTPQHGDGVLQLKATTVIPAGLVAPVEVTVVSVGAEVESC